MNNTNINKSFDKINLDWKLIQSELKLKLGIEVYESWIKKIDLHEEFNNYILLTVPTRFIRDWITSRYLDQILQTIRKHKKQIIRIEFKILEKKDTKSEKFDDLNQVNETQKVSFIKDSHLQYSRIDPNKRFDNFLIGASNKIAFEASLKVSENISYYNPLYIYGGVGLGKTHLLNAVGNTVLDHSENARICSLSAEHFTNKVISAIRSGKQNELRNAFRFDCDVLLIDDIQFLAGKEGTQQEFFHTFNSLMDKGSQIIISGDRPPNKLYKIQERIKSRFSGGLVIDIQQPDFELRYKIVKVKSEELKKYYSDQINISEEIQKFISSEIKNSIRELVGALNRVVSFSRIYNKTPNLSETKIVLKDLLNLPENKVSVDMIQSLVCKFFKISKNEMLSSRRSRYLVRPRQTAIYLTKILTSKSLPEIGREFSNRDHTTVIHSIKTIENLKKNDTELCANIDTLKNQILYNNSNEV